MSRIFDALQRSESERLGKSVSTATELLEVAERQAVKTGRFNESATGNGSVRASSLTASEAVSAIGVTGEAQVPFVAEQSVGYDQFKTLKVAASPESRLVCLTDTESLAAEKFGFLSVRLQHIQRTKPLKTVLITSSMPGEGKSMVSANLTCTLAQKTKKRVLLVEGDLRRPSLAQMFGLGKISGLSECLHGQETLMTSIYQLEGASLFILSAGRPSSNALELLQTRRLFTFMDQLKASFDWIIIDSPPVLPMADTSVLMRLADGILLVARRGVTEEELLERSVEAIEKDKLIGSVLNSSQNAAHSDYYNYYSSPSSRSA